MLPSFDDVAAFVCEEAGANRSFVTEATSLQGDIGLYGVDIDALLEAYEKRYGVDLAGYLWYFHTGEEGFNVGGLFFRSPDRCVKQIPITIGMLYRFAQSKKWSVDYPAHKVPRFRFDLLINGMLVFGYLAFIFASIGACLWSRIW